MDKWNNTKEKQRLVFYTIAGGYLLYQGITLIDSLLKKGSTFSGNFLLYIFSVIFILCGSVLLFYVLKGYKKHLDEMKNTQHTDSLDEPEYQDAQEYKAEPEYKNGSEDKEEMKESLEENEKHLKEEGKEND